MHVGCHCTKAAAVCSSLNARQSRRNRLATKWSEVCLWSCDRVNGRGGKPQPTSDIMPPPDKTVSARMGGNAWHTDWMCQAWHHVGARYHTWRNTRANLGSGPPRAMESDPGVTLKESPPPDRKGEPFIVVTPAAMSSMDSAISNSQDGLLPRHYTQSGMKRVHP